MSYKKPLLTFPTFLKTLKTQFSFTINKEASNSSETQHKNNSNFIDNVFYNSVNRTCCN